MGHNTKTAIDAIVLDWLGLELTDPYVPAKWRPTILRKMQKVVGIDLWNFTDWRFKQTSAVVVAVAGVGPLPTNFAVVGSKGSVWVVGQQHQLTYADPERVRSERNLSPSATGLPDFYTIYGSNIELDKPVSYSLELSYEKQAPVLVDVVTIPGNGLDLIPADAHEAIIEGTIDLLSVPAGDARGATELSPRFRKALADIASRQVQGKEQLQQYGDYGITQEGMW